MVVLLQCPGCRYRMIDGQRRCPECGWEGVPRATVAAGRASDVRWHRGWAETAFGLGVAFVVGLVGVAMILAGGPGSALPCGVPVLLCAGLVLYGTGREVRRRLAQEQSDPDEIAFDDDVLDLGRETVALEAIERVRLEPTRRAERWRLACDVLPFAAIAPADALEHADAHPGFVGLDGAGGTVEMLLATTGGTAREFAAALEDRAGRHRAGRPDGAALVGALLAAADTGAPVVHDRFERIALRVADDGLRDVGRRRRTIPWAIVADFDLASTGLKDGPGGAPLWTWTLLVVRRPLLDCGLRVGRRSIRIPLAHADPRAGVALWAALTRARDQATSRGS